MAKTKYNDVGGGQTPTTPSWLDKYASNGPDYKKIGQFAAQNMSVSPDWKAIGSFAAQLSALLDSAGVAGVTGGGGGTTKPKVNTRGTPTQYNNTGTGVTQMIPETPYTPAGANPSLASPWNTASAQGQYGTGKNVNIPQLAAGYGNIYNRSNVKSDPNILNMAMGNFIKMATGQTPGEEFLSVLQAAKDDIEKKKLIKPTTTTGGGGGGGGYGYGGGGGGGGGYSDPGWAGQLLNMLMSWRI